MPAQQRNSLRIRGRHPGGSGRGSHADAALYPLSRALPGDLLTCLHLFTTFYGPRGFDPQPTIIIEAGSTSLMLPSVRHATTSAQSGARGPNAGGMQLHGPKSEGATPNPGAHEIGQSGRGSGPKGNPPGLDWQVRPVTRGVGSEGRTHQIDGSVTLHLS
jgi:hypothetical protein